MTDTATEERPEVVDVLDAAAADDDTSTDGKGLSLLHDGKFDLTLRTDQTGLTPAQWSGLQSVLNFDLAEEPQALPYVEAFLHLCATRGLDPWAKEAHLIARGEGANRTYTMQVGIDGFRKTARSTGLYRNRVGVFWTGKDDDDDSWTEVEVPGVGTVRRRVWLDHWPESRGYPGAARCVVEHYDEKGEITYTDGVADWAMYAPWIEKREWKGPAGHKRREVVRNEDGTPVMVLMSKWQDGFAFMLGKCAEALALRAMAPGRLSGVYTFEEMHQADRDERKRLDEQRAQARREYAAGIRGADTTVPGEVVRGVEVPSGGDSTSAPLDDTVDAEEVPAGPPGEAAPGRDGWLAEYAAQADVLGVTAQRITTRRLRQHKAETVGDLDDDALSALVRSMRGACARRLAAKDPASQVAQWYAACEAEPGPLPFTG